MSVETMPRCVPVPRRRIAWERLAVLALCAAFWIGVVYVVALLLP